jgi:hypothetical protein
VDPIENRYMFPGELKMRVVHKARRTVLRVVRGEVVITELHMSHETARHLAEDLWRQA